MEDRFSLTGTDETPEIIFDRVKNEFKISGRSMPENAYEFYLPVHNWFEAYVQNPNDHTKLEIDLDYFNSGSVKQVFKLLCLIEEITEVGKAVEVKWSYKKGDELMQMKGHEFDKFLDINIQLIER